MKKQINDYKPFSHIVAELKNNSPYFPQVKSSYYKGFPKQEETRKNTTELCRFKRVGGVTHTIRPLKNKSKPNFYETHPTENGNNFTEHKTKRSDFIRTE